MLVEVVKKGVTKWDYSEKRQKADLWMSSDAMSQRI